jgi:hypothetical protein
VVAKCSNHGARSLRPCPPSPTNPHAMPRRLSAGQR